MSTSSGSSSTGSCAVSGATRSGAPLSCTSRSAAIVSRPSGATMRQQIRSGAAALASGGGGLARTFLAARRSWTGARAGRLPRRRVFRRTGRCLGCDLNLDTHAETVRRKSQPGAPDRYRLLRVARHRHPDKVAIADNAVGGIELDPAGARKIDLYPGMGGAAAHMAVAIALRDVEIARNEAPGETQRTHRLHHQDGEVAAGATAELQRQQRVLHSFLMARDIGEALPYGVGDGGQQLMGVGWPVPAQELARPAVELVIGVEVLPLDAADEVGHLLGAVGERIGAGVLVDAKSGRIDRRMVETNGADEAQLLGAATEARDGDAIAEDVVYPAQIRRLRRDSDRRLDQPLIIAVARPEHDPVLAQGDRPLVAVGGDVVDVEDWHGTGLAWDGWPASGQPIFRACFAPVGDRHLIRTNRGALGRRRSRARRHAPGQASRIAGRRAARAISSFRLKRQGAAKPQAAAAPEARPTHAEHPRRR